MSIISELSELNKSFLANDKNGIITGNNNFIYKQGKLPIILSAPHAVRQVRNGQIKLSDYLTGPLAIYLANTCDCSYFVRTFNASDDPNFPNGITLSIIDSLYLKKLVSFIKELDAFLVIDMHGCTNDKLADCSLWSDSSFPVDPCILQIFYNNYKNNGINYDSGTEFNGGQVTRQSAILTNAFQLEIKRCIRSLKSDDYPLLQAFLNSMQESIYETYDYARARKKI